MAKNIVIVILVLVAAGAGYLAYTGQTANQATQTELAAAQEALDAAEANAREQADAVAAVKADVSNQVSTLEAELAEKTTELNTALAEARQRVEDTLADLSAAKARESQLDSKISALENTLSARNAGIETLAARVNDLQSQYDNAQAKIAELSAKLENTPSMASPMDDRGMAATTEPEPAMGPADTPQLPLEIDSRKALFSSAVTVTVSHTGEAALTVSAAISGPESEGMSPRELVIPAGQEVRLGVRDDWKLRSGQTLTLTHADYEPLVYVIP